MVRASKKEEPVSDQPTEVEEERRRLKKLLFSRNLYSKGPSKANSALAPSKLVAKHHGRDIVKKSQRKNRFLFSFPGLLAPVTGGKIGELKDLETKNPVLYLDFPQGQMKLFGTIVYPKNRYLTLQFSRGGKNVTCEDYFDNMIVFSDAWWIGRKSENPEELRLEFPKDLNEERHAEYDFKGGAGATCEEKPGANKSGKEHVEPHSPRVNVEDDASGDSSPLTGGVSKNLLELTPIRHSARTAGKKLKYAETASENDSVESDDNVTEGTKKIDTEKTDHAAFSSPLEENCDSSSKDIARCNMNAAAMTDLPGNNQSSSISVKKLKESSLHKRGPLIQATIATLFEKVEEKKSTISVKRSSPRRVFGQKSRHIDLKQKSNQLEDEQPRKKGEVAKKKKTGSESTTKQQSQKQQAQVVDDEIEEFSSELEDSDGSDEDWAA